jgi:hypothetical protein
VVTPEDFPTNTTSLAVKSILGVALVLKNSSFPLQVRITGGVSTFNRVASNVPAMATRIPSSYSAVPRAPAMVPSTVLKIMFPTSKVAFDDVANDFVWA